MMLMGPVSTEPKIELDMDLRPEGKNGPVVRSYASCEEYYRAWASVWERQALLRARFAAGDKELAEDYRKRGEAMLEKALPLADKIYAAVVASL